MTAEARERRDEAVAAAVERLNVDGLLRIVAERLSERADRLGERRIGDERILPDRVDQILPRDHLTRPRDEVSEHAKDPGRQRDLAAGAPQQAVGRVEGKWAERDHPRPILRESSGLLRR